MLVNAHDASFEFDHRPDHDRTGELTERSRIIADDTAAAGYKTAGDVPANASFESMGMTRAEMYRADIEAKLARAGITLANTDN